MQSCCLCEWPWSKVIKAPPHQNNEMCHLLMMGNLAIQPCPTPCFNPGVSSSFGTLLAWCYLHLWLNVARFMGHKLKWSERSSEELRVEFTEGETQRSYISKCCIRMVTIMRRVLFLNRESLEWVSAPDVAFKGHMVGRKSLRSWPVKTPRSSASSQSVFFFVHYRKKIVVSQSSWDIWTYINATDCISGLWPL